MKEYYINCLAENCGFEVRGEDEDDLVARMKEHERERHGRNESEERLHERIERS